MGELMRCGVCGHEEEQLDECNDCGQVYCKHCGIETTGQCMECENEEFDRN
ncbi:hypothetical protein [Romboutsia sp.]|uniref:hypothetical protein n=1 Tax=Romboutsia sp. TaxID=1965302 RepID=UPI002CA83855|nr:hypothetical protein [Romboutsia sp.]HSQ88009.1 hypothetical protein [Romboutsia sp.]